MNEGPLPAGAGRGRAESGPELHRPRYPPLAMGTRRRLMRGLSAWVGPGRVVEAAAVVVEGSRVTYAGPAWQAPEADEEVQGDWFLLPGVVDHHVHLGLSDPRAVLHGGVTAVRDLAWPPEDIFPLADISQATDFDGPLIVAAGPMITVPGGYPTRAGWAGPGTDRASPWRRRRRAGPLSLDGAAVRRSGLGPGPGHDGRQHPGHSLLWSTDAGAGDGHRQPPTVRRRRWPGPVRDRPRQRAHPPRDPCRGGPASS